jgi:ABC-type cobalamin/Fe3+-siderophores transport system ATPase subunit
VEAKSVVETPQPVPQSPATPQPKTIKQTVIIVRRPAADVEKRVRDSVRQAVAKAMGRIYQD